MGRAAYRLRREASEPVCEVVGRPDSANQITEVRVCGLRGAHFLELMDRLRAASSAQGPTLHGRATIADVVATMLRSLPLPGAPNTEGMPR